MFAEVGTLGADPDDRLMSRPEILEPMKVWMREGARQGAGGYTADWIAECGPWGFSRRRYVGRFTSGGARQIASLAALTRSIWPPLFPRRRCARIPTRPPLPAEPLREILTALLD